MSEQPETVDHHESSLDKLVRMVNQIAVAFRTMPEPQAVSNIAEHVRAFWTPKMRREACDYARRDGARLEPLARAALMSMDTADGG